MSCLSGYCDLYDHISFEKMYDHGTYKTSDLLECFEIFKKRTGGVLFIDTCVDKITPYNQDFVKAHSNGTFSFEEKSRQVADKRCKDGTRTETYYTYTLYGKDCTLKDINKSGVYITTEIHFNTLLDILPYLSRKVTISATNNGKEVVYISNHTVESEYMDMMTRSGYEGGLIQHFRAALSDLYVDVCKNYILKDIDARTHIEPVVIVDKAAGIAEASKDIDYMHAIKFVWDDNETKSYWASPKLVEGNKYKLSEFDMQHFADDIKAGKLKVCYVEKLVYNPEALSN